MKLSLKLIGFIPILFLLCGVASAVTVPSNITINLTNVNLTVENLTFDSLIVGTDTVSFSNSDDWSNLTITPDNPINISVSKWNITGDYQKSWNKTGDALVTYTISGLPTDRYVRVVTTNNTIELIANSLGLIAFNSSSNTTYDIRLSTYLLHEEEEEAQINEIKDTFVNSWQDTVSMIGVMIVISLAGSALMIFRGKKNISSLLEDMPGILLIVVLIVIGAIIFGSFN